MSETTQTDLDRRELVAFLKGQTIAGLRFDARPGGAFDLIFTDGSELELYIVGDNLTWVTMTAEEVATEEARDTAGLLELEAQIAAGQAPIFDHAEVWAELDAEEGTPPAA
jgi:hypothetical protein